MKSIVGVGGFLCVSVIIVGVHYGIISTNIREKEVERGLEDAFEYCIDTGTDDKDNFEKRFCVTLNKMMITDGELDVYFIDDEWDDGYIDIIVEETFEYGFFGKKGKNRWERAYRIV